MSPILVRPVREQLEHDRIIRLLQPKYRRRFTVGVNPGAEQTAAVGAGPGALYPDLVLTSTGRSHKLTGVVEVETGESVNNLEAIAQWAAFGRLPVEFALYVPTTSVEVTKRLCADHQIGVTEIWSYHMVGDQLRFTQVQRQPIEGKLAAARAAAAAVRRAANAARPGATVTSKAPSARPARKAAAKKPTPKKAPAKKAAARKPARKTR